MPRSYLCPRAGGVAPGTFIVTVFSDVAMALGVFNWGTMTTNVKPGTSTVVRPPSSSGTTPMLNRVPDLNRSADPRAC
ncbi:hypothetical protein PHET_11075 [Paragonimus heterotremus]|uniref:Uncharacterized protein n=1 Tax=Paragonimus heterotremus TaxID=100268 RepID=A0A8J4SK15_9TREM|nr:hypothetical protein PHET_11075 [Paragonimus heterotremus]